MKTGEVRIIGGQWRSRKLKFPAVEGLRPTTDRVRETVFNWLSPYIVGSNCLDLFAGSGALGFEALSRGAAHVVFIDSNPAIIQYLKNQLILFKCQAASVYPAKIPLAKLPLEIKFDIVFLDPPFYKNLLAGSCLWLEQNNYLAEEALIYLETESNLSPLPIPKNWTIIQSKTAGQTGYHLAKRINLP